MTPQELMLYAGIVFAVTLTIVIANFLSIFNSRNVSGTMIFIHIAGGALASLSGTALVGGFIWFLVTIS